MRTAAMIAALSAAGPVAAAAQQPGATAALDAQTRATMIEVFGTDPCPVGGNDEIVVCARLPEEERYRLPRNFRENPQRRINESWAVNVQELQYVGREGIMSCSTVGQGGFTGCWEEMMRQAREDRAVSPEGQPIP